MLQVFMESRGGAWGGVLISLVRPWISMMRKDEHFQKEKWISGCSLKVWEVPGCGSSQFERWMEGLKRTNWNRGVGKERTDTNNSWRKDLAPNKLMYNYKLKAMKSNFEQTRHSSMFWSFFVLAMALAAPRDGQSLNVVGECQGLVSLENVEGEL